MLKIPLKKTLLPNARRCQKWRRPFDHRVFPQRIFYFWMPHSRMQSLMISVSLRFIGHDCIPIKWSAYEFNPQEINFVHLCEHNDNDPGIFFWGGSLRHRWHDPIIQMENLNPPNSEFLCLEVRTLNLTKFLGKQRPKSSFSWQRKTWRYSTYLLMLAPPKTHWFLPPLIFVESQKGTLTFDHFSEVGKDGDDAWGGSWVDGCKEVGLGFFRGVFFQ